MVESRFHHPQRKGLVSKELFRQALFLFNLWKNQNNCERINITMVEMRRNNDSNIWCDY